MQLKKGVDKASELPFLSSLLRTNPTPFKASPVAIYPALYRDNQDTLLDVPFDLCPPGMNIPFSANQMRVIFVATRSSTRVSCKVSLDPRILDRSIKRCFSPIG